MGYFSRFKVRGFNRVFLADGITCSFVEEKGELLVIETRFQLRIREAVLYFEYIFRWLLEHVAEVLCGEFVKV